MDEDLRKEVQRLIDAGVPEAEIGAFIQRWQGGAAPAQAATGDEAPDTGITAGNLARSAVQGATFGFGDEIAGGLAKLTGGNYTETRDAYRRKDDAFREAHPIADIATQAVAGLATGGAAALARSGGRLAAAAMFPRASRVLAQRAAKMEMARMAAPTAMETMSRAGAVGGALGAVQGVGDARGAEGEMAGLGDYAANVGLGVGIGGMVGAAIPLVGGALKSVVGRLRGAENPTRVANATKKYLVDMAEDAGGVDAIAARHAARQAARPGTVLADDEYLYGVGDLAMSKAPSLRGEFAETLERRAKDEQGLLQKDVIDAVGKSPFDVDANLRRAAEEAKKRAEFSGDAGRYQTAGRAADPSNMGIPFKGSTAVPFKSWGELFDAHPDLKAFQMTLPRTGQPSFTQLQEIDQTIAKRLKDAYAAGKPNQIERLKAAQGDFREAFGEAVPSWKQLQQDYAKASRLVESFDKGQAAFRGEASVVEREFLSLPKDEQENYAVGMLHSLLRSMGDMQPNQDAARKFLADLDANVPSNVAKRIRLLFKSDADIQKLVQKAKTSMAIRRTAQAGKGSQTFPRQALDEAMRGGPEEAAMQAGIHGMAYTGPTGAGLAGFTALLGASPKTSRRVMQNIGPGLFDPAKADDLIGQMRDAVQGEYLRRARRRGGIPLLSGLVGSQAAGGLLGGQ